MKPRLPNALTTSTVVDEECFCLCRKLLEDMSIALHRPEQPLLAKDLIKLPARERPEDAVTTSHAMLQATLLHRFQQLQGIASEQRYYFANLADIMLKDYETFVGASVLNQDKLCSFFKRITKHAVFAEHISDASSLHNMRWFATQGLVRKTKSLLLNSFGFFLELNTAKTFWRTIELTSFSFLEHLERYAEEADGPVVMTDMAKGSLLQLLGHVFWSLQHAQNELDSLRDLLQERDMVFRPEVARAGLDVNLIIAQLSKAAMHDFPLVSKLLSKFKNASHYRGQMQDITVEVMGAIDELSTRFRVIEVLLEVADLVATEEEIKGALLSFEFEAEGEEIVSRQQDMVALISSGQVKGHGSTRLPGVVPTPRKASILQKLIVRENSVRQKYADCFMSTKCLSVQRRLTKLLADDSEVDDQVWWKNANLLCDDLKAQVDGGFTLDMFDSFKVTYSRLYRDVIRQQFKECEYSLLPSNVAKRFEHRREVAKRKKKKTCASEKEKEDVDLSLASITTIDPYSFWAVGDVEKYIPPVLKEKVKTRKQHDLDDDFSVCAPEIPAGTPSLSKEKRSLDDLKPSDFVTWDLLFRKVKGTLKWSNLVQPLTRLGCAILNLDGSKRKVVDSHTGLAAVLHMPHPGDDCRPDQRDAYRLHIEDWLQMKYSELVPEDSREEALSL